MNLTCKVGGSSGVAALNVNGLSSTSFTAITYVNSTQKDAIVHCSVLN